MVGHCCLQHLRRRRGIFGSHGLEHLDNVANVIGCNALDHLSSTAHGCKAPGRNLLWGFNQEPMKILGTLD